jgi:hypothetical protein
VVAEFDIGPLHCRPSRAVSYLFLPFVSGVGGKSMIERFAIDILGMRWQTAADGRGQVGIRAVWHGLPFH